MVIHVTIQQVTLAGMAYTIVRLQTSGLQIESSLALFLSHLFQFGGAVVIRAMYDHDTNTSFAYKILHFEE